MAASGAIVKKRVVRMLPQSSGPQKPAVWGWYVTYCVAMAFLYFVTVVMGLIMLLTGPTGPDVDPVENKIISFIFIGMGLALLIPFAAGPLLPRRRWAWVVGLVLIVIGMTSMCCLPVAIPLLIWWIKPETKEYYYQGRSGAEAGPGPLPVANVTHKKCPGCGLNNVPAATRCERCGTALAS